MKLDRLFKLTLMLGLLLTIGIVGCDEEADPLDNGDDPGQLLVGTWVNSYSTHDGVEFNHVFTAVFNDDDTGTSYEIDPEEDQVDVDDFTWVADDVSFTISEPDEEDFTLTYVFVGDDEVTVTGTDSDDGSVNILHMIRFSNDISVDFDGLNVVGTWQSMTTPDYPYQEDMIVISSDGNMVNIYPDEEGYETDNMEWTSSPPWFFYKEEDNYPLYGVVDVSGSGDVMNAVMSRDGMAVQQNFIYYRSTNNFDQAMVGNWNRIALSIDGVDQVEFGVVMTTYSDDGTAIVNWEGTEMTTYGSTIDMPSGDDVFIVFMDDFEVGDVGYYHFTDGNLIVTNYADSDDDGTFEEYVDTYESFE